jgi:DNA-binding PadR family transcriptional regulator
VGGFIGNEPVINIPDLQIKWLWEMRRTVILLARVYTYLYELEKEGVLETRLSGRSKLYIPTAKGGGIITRRLNELTTAYDQVLRGRK